MWTIENRARYDRSKLRYPSDLTDEEWSHVEPLIRPGKRGSNKRTVNVREVVNGLMYILSTGCQWRAIPKDLPPRSTVYDYFELWSWDGTLDRIHDTLYVKCREQASRDASPTVGQRVQVNGFDWDAPHRAPRSISWTEQWHFGAGSHNRCGSRSSEHIQKRQRHPPPSRSVNLNSLPCTRPVGPGTQARPRIPGQPNRESRGQCVFDPTFLR